MINSKSIYFALFFAICENSVREYFLNLEYFSNFLKIEIPCFCQNSHLKIEIAKINPTLVYQNIWKIPGLIVLTLNKFKLCPYTNRNTSENLKARIIKAHFLVTNKTEIENYLNCSYSKYGHASINGTNFPMVVILYP